MNNAENPFYPGLLKQLKRLADELDRRVESRNNHDFCGCHRSLAVLLERHAGAETAIEIMREIRNLGGMDYMGSDRLTARRLRIAIPWQAWEIPQGYKRNAIIK